MNEIELASHILLLFSNPPTTLPSIRVDDTRRNNARRCMTSIACHRLSQNGTAPSKLRQATFEWNGGVFALRNSRIVDHHWSTTHDSLIERLRELADQRPLVYLLTYWDVDNGILHVWSVPGKVAIEALGKLPTHSRTGWKTVEVGVVDHQLRNAQGVPSFAPYYIRSQLSEAERAKLLEAIKTDDNIKRERLAIEADLGEEETTERTSELGEADEPSDEPPVVFTEQTVEFLLELPDRIDDGPWHEQNKRRYHDVLRNPSQAIVEGLRTRYIQRLSPAVAGGKRHLSMLKKNDWGRGGYHDHFWFAFYDPASGNKIKSVQLFVSFLGAKAVSNLNRNRQEGFSRRKPRGEFEIRDTRGDDY